jgi:large subunit ribosomal protein L9
MEVILRQAVEQLGHPGDIVKVSAGFARNYLLPRGFAYEATAGNRKRIEQERQRLEQAEEQRRGVASEEATKLEQVSLTFSARVGEEGKLFGSVTASDIAPTFSWRWTSTVWPCVTTIFWRMSDCIPESDTFT